MMGNIVEQADRDPPVLTRESERKGRNKGTRRTMSPLGNRMELWVWHRCCMCSTLEIMSI